MGGMVNNCKKCNKLFQQIRQPYCHDCNRIEEEKFSTLYRALQKSASTGGRSIDDLSAEMDIPVEDIERYFLEGCLGTAGTYLQINCQGCGMSCNANQRLGRYCVTCSELTANKAKVEVYSIHELNKRHSETQRREQQAEMLKQNQEKRSAYSKFGNALKQR
jgi:hypothetical protein